MIFKEEKYLQENYLNGKYVVLLNTAAYQNDICGRCRTNVRQIIGRIEYAVIEKLRESENVGGRRRR